MPALMPDARGDSKAKPKTEVAMDWDDVLPTPQKAAVLGENLRRLSVAELEARIVQLKAEIVRVEGEMAAKRAQASAAAKLFRS
jgi:uncharacterized small protein (DUF1192 family)